MDGLSFAFAIGAPVWKPIFEYEKGTIRVAWTFFAIYIFFFDLDMWFGNVLKAFDSLEKKVENYEKVLENSFY